MKSPASTFCMTQGTWTSSLSSGHQKHLCWKVTLSPCEDIKSRGIHLSWDVHSQMLTTPHERSAFGSQSLLLVGFFHPRKPHRYHNHCSYFRLMSQSPTCFSCPSIVLMPAFYTTLFLNSLESKALSKPNKTWSLSKAETLRSGKTESTVTLTRRLKQRGGHGIRQRATRKTQTHLPKSHLPVR